MRRHVVLFAIGALILVTGPRPGSAPVQVQAAIEASSAAPAVPSLTPSFVPASANASGRVVRRTPSGVVIESVERIVELDLTQVVGVWRETYVSAGAIEVGDDLFVNGTEGSPFIAKYVWANIGRMDGVIESIDATGMVLGVSRHDSKGGLGPRTAVRVDLSPHIEYGAPGHPIARADLAVGRTVGLVVYRPRTGPARATRVW
jgi:hypothetical protein